MKISEMAKLGMKLHLALLEEYNRPHSGMCYYVAKLKDSGVISSEEEEEFGNAVYKIITDLNEKHGQSYVFIRTHIIKVLELNEPSEVANRYSTDWQAVYRAWENFYVWWYYDLLKGGL